jgi:hypothetical protein
MEARALARLGDAKACDRALAEAVREFEQRNPAEDPDWFQYFDEAGTPCGPQWSSKEAITQRCGLTGANRVRPAA